MRFDQLKRREFFMLLGGAAAWPLAVHAQQGERMRRIGVLMNLAPEDSESQRRLTAFVQGLQELGWTDGRNVRIETRWGAGDPDRIRSQIAQLLSFSPDVMLASGDSTLQPLRVASRTLPIVFVIVPDPVGAGIVESLARPGGNSTGFTNIEYGTSVKWLELLKQVAPGVQKVAVLRDPDLRSGIGQWGAIQAVAPSFNVELRPIDVRDAAETERAVGGLAGSTNVGLIVATSAVAIFHRNRIIALAARHKLPAIYAYRIFADEGGLISYGPDLVDQYRQAAHYVDRILNGEKPADLPVQAPTKYELVINLKTAKALGLDMPPMLLARADEVIE